MNNRLEGKVALVTGGTSGIGLATAQRFVAEGAHVYITGRREAELRAAAATIGRNVTAIRGDVSNLGDLDGLFAAIGKAHGRLDVLFANAGGGGFAPLEAVTEAHFDKYFGINVKGTLFTVQKALPLMAAGSAIVLNASIAGIKGFPAFSVYAATKAAVRSFARSWSTDLKERGIRVNAISPGTIITPAYQSELGLSDSQLKDFDAQAAAAAPLGRTGTPDEIAAAVLFLASDDASFITGIDLVVDGGTTQV